MSRICNIHILDNYMVAFVDREEKWKNLHQKFMYYVLMFYSYYTIKMNYSFIRMY